MDTKDIVEKLTELSLAAGLEAAKPTLEPLLNASLGLIAPAALAVVPGAGAALVNLALEHKRKRTLRKFDDWLTLVAMYLELGSVEAARQHIEEQIDEPWVHDNLIGAARAIFDDFDDCVLPALARLVASHMKAKTRPDTRTKRAIAMLGAFDSPMLSGLQDLVRCTLPLVPSAVNLIQLYAYPAKQTALGDGWTVRLSTLDSQELGSFDVPHDPLSVFHLLKSGEFARDNPGGAMDTLSGPQVAVISLKALRYLGKLVT